MKEAVFLQEHLVPLLAAIPIDRQPLWGKMNVQQMVEHLSREGFQQAAGLMPQPLVSTPEVIVRMQAFIRSEKAFRENTVNPLMPETPYPLRYDTMMEALDALQNDMVFFFAEFRQSPGKTVVNPLFGELDYELSVLLLYKHCLHHLRQFGVAPGSAMS